MPTLEIYNNQAEEEISDELLEKFSCIGNLAVVLALENPAHGGGVLSALEEIEIAIVNDKVIAQVHADFMDIAGATDVITFEHGEIVISAQTAREYSARFHHSFEKELMLYITHGLLHLAGHEDDDPQERKAMEQIQNQILDQLWTD